VSPLPLPRDLTRPQPCEAPGPAWGLCGNDAVWVVRRRDGTRGVGYWCQDHRDSFQFRPGHEDDLVFTPWAPAVAP
jgi:hypothetical protein